MKAVICTKYGGPEVLEVKEVNRPQPKENEILIKIKASAVTAAGCIMRTGKPYFGRLFLGFLRPKNATPGTDLAGEIVEIGSKVDRFKIGDEVIATTDIECGCHAEYITLSQDAIVLPKPSSMTYEEATGMIDGATTALSFFIDSIKLEPGQKVLINGASGSIGTAAVQLALHFGAEVTGVCSTKNQQLVKSLGAQHVLDYTAKDFELKKNTYDIIFDTVGKMSFSQTKKALRKGGQFLTPVLSMGVLMQVLLGNIFRSKKVVFSATGMRKKESRHANLRYLTSLIDAGHLRTLIDRTYSINQIREAHEYVERGHKQGNVVLVFD